MNVWLSDGSVWEASRHDAEIIKDYLTSGLKRAIPISMRRHVKKTVETFTGYLNLANVIGVGDLT